MEEYRKQEEGLTLEELEGQTLELLPAREEMWTFNNYNISVALAQQGAIAQSNQGVFYN